MEIIHEEDFQQLAEVEARVSGKIGEETVAQKTVPPGYIPIHLTTNGRLGAPALVHVRNFKTSDLVSLSVETQETLPEAVVNLISGIVYEKTSVTDWHEQELIELLLKMYANFYGLTLPSIPFPWTEEDVEYLRRAGRQSEADSLENGQWKPRVDIDLTKVEFFDLDPKAKVNVTVSAKDGFSVTFRPPRFGDVLVIKRFLREKFLDREARFAPLRKRYTKDETLLTEKETEELLAYEKERLLYTTELMRCLNIHKAVIDGKEVIPTSIHERIAIARDPRFDVRLLQVADNAFAKIKFGVNPEVEVLSPITYAPVTRRFSFRLVDLLSALRVQNADEYVVQYDD